VSYRVEDPEGNVVKVRSTLCRARLDIEGAPYGWLVTDEDGVVLAFRGERAESVRVRSRNDAIAEAKRLGRPLDAVPHPAPSHRRRRRFWMTHPLRPQ
jgi:hypothetical protein